jgi:hypothetical protein
VSIHAATALLIIQTHRQMRQTLDSLGTDTMIGMSDLSPSQASQSRYHVMVMRLRASLADETDCLYFVHTPVGTINVSGFNYAIPGFVSIRGEDENQKYRFLVFSEEEICSFPLEIKRKKAVGSKETLGFRPDLQNGSEEKA